jgi:hypothetical protein
MTHPRREGLCQGNFAASVKEIWPIDEYDALALAGVSERNSANLPKDSRRQLLDRPYCPGVIRFTQARVPRRSSCPNPRTPKANRSVSKAP